MKNIIENIKLVGEFMGWKENKDMKVKLISGGITNNFQKNDEACIPEAMCYHSSWDWLMEVVEKIEDLSKEGETYMFSITKFSVRVIYKGSRIVDLPIDNTKIEAVYNACVEFIKWYNNHLCSNCGRFDDVVGTHNIDTCEECALNN